MEFTIRSSRSSESPFPPTSWVSPCRTWRSDGLLRVAENEEVREMMMTWADEIRAQGIEQGKEQGVEEGRQQGVERMRDVVLDVVAQRFGDLSERSRRAISAIKSLDELAELAKKALRVSSLEELKIG